MLAIIRQNRRIKQFVFTASGSESEEGEMSGGEEGGGGAKRRKKRMKRRGKRATIFMN